MSDNNFPHLDNVSDLVLDVVKSKIQYFWTSFKKLNCEVGGGTYNLCVVDVFILFSTYANRYLHLHFTQFYKIDTSIFKSLCEEVFYLLQSWSHWRSYSLQLLFGDWNHYMHAISGNIKKTFRRCSNILFQNIPWNKNQHDVQIALDILLSSKPALLGIGETDFDKLNSCHFPGYFLLRGLQSNPINKKIRMNLLIKDGVDYEELNMENEIPTCTILLDGWRICFAYREWSKGGDVNTSGIPLQKERWDTFVERWNEFSGRGIMLGDMNFCLLHGNTPYQRKLEHFRETVTDHLLLDRWTQLVEEETRHQTGSQPALLDHLYVTDYSYIDRVYNDMRVDSDHHVIGLRLRHDGQVVSSKTYEWRFVEGIDTLEFERLYKISNLWELFTENDVDSAVAKFNRKVSGVLDKLAPKQIKVAGKPQAAWINDEIQKDLAHRKELRLIAEKTNSPADWSTYKKARNRLRNKMRRTEEAYTKEYLNCQDEKTKWSRIKTYAGLEKMAGADMEMMTDFGKTKSGPILSSFMNSYFKQKVEKLKAKTQVNLEKALDYTKRYKSKNNALFEDEFAFKNVDLEHLLRHANNLTNTNAMGVDEISTRVIKKFSRALLPSILHIVNLALTKSQYPSLWKTGIILPIPKRGDLSLPQNWRPIVLNTVVSKLLERVMNEQIMEFMTRNLLDPTTQHAYRRGKSCQTALTDVDSFIQKARNEKKTVIMCLTDQSAAFNVLQKDVLVGKLKILGFSSSACKLIDNYLTGRKTKCLVNGAMSSSVDLSSGVGEGSVLGPSLYTLGQVCVSMVMDIVKDKMKEVYNVSADVLSCEYADDVTGLAALDNDEDAQLTVDIIMSQYADYFSACGLCLNQDKCMVMVIRSKPRTREIIWQGKPEEKKVKLLGVYIDNRYEFYDHVNYLVKTCSFKMSCIRRISKWLTDDNLKDVVRSLVLSHLTYCSEIYLRLPSVQSKIQKILNSAARLALRRDRYANCEVMMKDLNWLNIANHYRTQLLTSLRRILSTGSAFYTYSFIDGESRASMRTRLMKLSWKHQNKYGKNCFIQNAVREWNAMKIGTKLFKNMEEFKDWIVKEAKSLYGNKNL